MSLPISLEARVALGLAVSRPASAGRAVCSSSARMESTTAGIHLAIAHGLAHELGLFANEIEVQACCTSSAQPAAWLRRQNKTPRSDCRTRGRLVVPPAFVPPHCRPDADGQSGCTLVCAVTGAPGPLTMHRIDCSIPARATWRRGFACAAGRLHRPAARCTAYGTATWLRAVLWAGLYARRRQESIPVAGEVAPSWLRPAD